MIKIGDMVKIVDLTGNGVGESVELIPKGTICAVKEITEDNLIEVIPLKFLFSWRRGFYYSMNDVEKGHLEWVKEKE